MPIKALAEEHGGKRTVSYNQAKGLKQNWRQLIPQSQGGVCGGLALMWLAARKSGLTSQVFHEKYAAALFKYAEHAQQLGADNLMGGGTGIDFVAKSFSLDKASVQVNVNNANVAKWIVTGPSSFVFIALQGHAVAADVKKPKVLFFDPNYGVFSFPDTLKFALFIKDYLLVTNKSAKFIKFYR